MRIVFWVGKFSCLLASCCSVEVVKGRGALRIRSLVFTSLTRNSPSLHPRITASHSAAFFSSLLDFPFPLYLAVRGFPEPED